MWLLMTSGTNSFRVTRLVLRTLASADLGWIAAPEAASKFLRDRGRPGWLNRLETRFSSDRAEFLPPSIRPPSYGASQDHGRPTFTTEFSQTYMPIVIEPSTKEAHDTGPLSWYLEWIKVGPTGAVSLCVRAELPPHSRGASVLEITKGYQKFRYELRRCWPGLMAKFVRYWSGALPEYCLDDQLAELLATHLEYYDIVDFDFLVGGKRVFPKTLYREGAADALRAIAGLSRMSQQMMTYGEEGVRALAEHDVGSRPDELWIINVDRLVRHHPEHMTNVDKRLFMEDIVAGIEILLQQRATLNYVTNWARVTRATFLDQLTDESDVESGHKVMRELLSEVAWMSDLFSETISVDSATGMSFFRTVISRVAALKEIDRLRGQVADSVNGLMIIAQAVFGERSAAASARLQSVSLSFERSSRNMAVATVLLTVAAIAITVAQILISAGR